MRSTYQRGCMTDKTEDDDKKLPTKKEVDEMLCEMIAAYSKLPHAAKLSPVNHSDLESVLMLLLALVRAV